MSDLIDFSKASYEHNYHKQATSAYIRMLSDLYSQQNTESYNEIRTYAANFTQGRCFYCGRKLYKVNDKGKIIFDKDVQYDHILPASLCGLYAKGNVVLASSDCNLEKSDLSVEEYYKQRLKQHKPTLYKSMDDLLKHLAIFQIPYREHWPEFMGFTMAAQKDSSLITFNTAKKLFINGIDFPDTLTSGNANIIRIMKSPNYKIWLDLRNPENELFQDYSENTISDITARVGSLFNMFSKDFSNETDVTKLSSDELIDWANNCLHLIALDSKSEHGKFLRLIRFLFEVLNVDSHKLNTYKQALNGIKHKDLYQQGTWSWFNAKSPVYKNIHEVSKVYSINGVIVELRDMYSKLGDESINNFTPIDITNNNLQLAMTTLIENNNSLKYKQGIKFFKSHLN